MTDCFSQKPQTVNSANKLQLSPTKSVFVCSYSLVVCRLLIYFVDKNAFNKSKQRKLDISTSQKTVSLFILTYCLILES